MTPSGIEAGPNVTGTHRRTSLPTEGGATERPAVMFHCNKCNETLDAARGTVRDARRIAFVAENALANGDVTRARAALGELTEALTGFDLLAAAVGDTPAAIRS